MLEQATIRNAVRGVFQRLKDLFAPVTGKTTMGGVAISALTDTILDQFFIVDDGRSEVYEAAEEMDTTVDEVAAALDILADNAVNAENGDRGAFQLVWKTGKIDAIEEMLDRVRWREKAYAIARDTLLYGDTFLQYVIDTEGNLVRLMYMPPHTMYRNEDQFGLLKSGSEPGDAAFEQYLPGDTKRVAFFYPWQIEHMRWNRSGTRKYGRSLLYTARTPWKKWQAMEEALVVNWLTRAFARLLFIIDVTDKSDKEAERYIHDFAEMLNRRQIATGTKAEEELSIVKDIFVGRKMHMRGGRAVPGLTDVKVLDTSNTAYLNLSALEYYRDKVIASLRVPKAYLGLERDINAKATLQQEDRRFVRTVQRIQTLMSEAIDHSIKVQLTLLGIDVNSVEYELLWPSPSWADRVEESVAAKNFADASVPMLMAGIIDPEYVQTKFLKIPVRDRERIGTGGSIDALQKGDDTGTPEE